MNHFMSLSRKMPASFTPPPLRRPSTDHTHPSRAGARVYDIRAGVRGRIGLAFRFRVLYFGDLRCSEHRNLLKFTIKKPRNSRILDRCAGSAFYSLTRGRVRPPRAFLAPPAPASRGPPRPAGDVLVECRVSVRVGVRDRVRVSVRLGVRDRVRVS